MQKTLLAALAIGFSATSAFALEGKVAQVSTHMGEMTVEVGGNGEPGCRSPLSQPGLHADRRNPTTATALTGDRNRTRQDALG